MFRSIGNAILYVVGFPMRVCRWCIECIVAVRKFLDLRRNQICASIVAVMMAVVGIQLRHSGYADAVPGEYAAVEFEGLQQQVPGTQLPEQKRSSSIREAIANSLKTIKSKLPSLSGSEETSARQPAATKVPIITASQQRPASPPATSQIVQPEKQTLILPEPVVVDLSDIEEPELSHPEIATLSGMIETDSDQSADDTLFGDN